MRLLLIHIPTGWVDDIRRGATATNSYTDQGGWTILGGVRLLLIHIPTGWVDDIRRGATATNSYTDRVGGRY